MDPGQKTRELSSDRKEKTNPDEKTREAPPDLEEEVREVPLDPEEGTQEAPPDPAEEETREVSSDPRVETNHVAGFAEESMDLEELVLPTRRKLTTSGNLLPKNVNAHVESTGVRRRERSSAATFSADERGRRRGECVNV